MFKRLFSSLYTKTQVKSDIEDFLKKEVKEESSKSIKKLEEKLPEKNEVKKDIKEEKPQKDVVKTTTVQTHRHDLKFTELKEPDTPVEDLPLDQMTDQLKQLKIDFTNWKQTTLHVNDDHITQMKLDLKALNVTFLVELSEDRYEYVSINIPDTYPKGEYEIVIEEADFGTKVEADSLLVCLENVLDEFDRKREEIKIEKQKQEEKIDLDILIEKSDKKNLNYEKWASEILEQLEKEVAILKKTKGYEIVLSPGENYISLSCGIIPKDRIKLSNLQGIARGFDMSRVLMVNLFIYLQNKAPEVNIFQADTFTSKDVFKGGLCKLIDLNFKEKFLPSFWKGTKIEKNFISSLFKHVEDFVMNCTQQCIICSKKLPIEGIKPTVCTKELCVFGHENYGLGIDLVYEIINHPDVVDIMVTITYAATNYNSRFDPFSPYPLGVNIKEKGEVKGFMSENGKNKDHKKVASVLDKIPNLDTLGEWAKKGKLKDSLDEIDKLAYPLLRWILASNRAHLKKLGKNEMIKEMYTEHQYYLLSSSPEKEEKFQKYKTQYGSFYAFHGSGLSNWHAILRNGLKNMSGTEGQLNGAAYGSGIYLAADSQTSFGYAPSGYAWKNSSFTKNLNSNNQKQTQNYDYDNYDDYNYNQNSSDAVTCLAMCEIIKHPVTWTMPNPYYVIANEDLVMTRYFFFYPGGGSASVVAKEVKPPTVSII